MTRVWVLLLALIGFPLSAVAEQVLPALYDVAGVAQGDVLNVRAEPKASAAILTKLARTAKSIEVVALSADRKWATVNTAEASGYVALRYLAPQNRVDWRALTSPIHCIGTEPFWGLDFDPATKGVVLTSPDLPPRSAKTTALWPGSLVQRTSAIAFGGGKLDGIATLRGAACSDGMSDRSYGIEIDLFLRAPTGASLRGCCSLLP